MIALLPCSVSRYSTRHVAYVRASHDLFVLYFVHVCDMLRSYV